MVMQNTQQRKINGLLDPVVGAMGYEYVGCDYIPQGARSILRVYVDKEGGIALDECVKVSRQISGVLDVEEAISGAYSLEVSSPGLDRPLFTLAQCQKFIGREVVLRLHLPVEGRRKIAGILQVVTDKSLQMQVDQAVIEVPFMSVTKANLVMKFK
jgi:ribosome maturation factor RimP